jgi:4-hydroxy-4-methyl-2-oxoglutarate aldolase
LSVPNKESSFSHEEAIRLSQQLATFSTSTVSDALDRYRIKGGMEGIMPVVDGLKMCGPAFTVRYIPVDQTRKGRVFTYIDDVKSGDVVVIDNGGRTYCTCWGDLLTRKAMKLSLAGTVVFGACRDVDTIRQLGYPVFSKGRFMMTGKDRVEVESTGHPITVGDIRVSPLDIILGDSSGVVCVPIPKAIDVLAAAKEIAASEEGIAASVEKGVSLTEARNSYGYERLQRAKD